MSPRFVRSAGTLWLLAALSPGCGRGSSNAPSARDACYPACLANLVKRCPLTSGCVANEEPDPRVGTVAESPGGVAICFASGERERNATRLDNGLVVYVRAADGTDCYRAVGEMNSRLQTWEISKDGEVVAALTRDTVDGAVTVTCDGVATEVDVTKPTCAALPWQSLLDCEVGADCSYGPITTPTPRDGGTPTCDGPCTSPPAATCSYDVNLDRSTLTTYPAEGSCEGIACYYPPSTMNCPYACYEAQCIGPLTSIANVAGSFVYNGVKQTVSLTGGGAPSTGPVTVTARTLPRGAAHTVDLRYRWRTATQISAVTETLSMTPDPSTPAGQSEYEQWTVDIPAQMAGRTIQFSLEARGYGGPFIISQPATGTDWSYTSN